MDGGVRAQCLFLLEAPGRKAVGSGFVSRDNPLETASGFPRLNAEAGLARERTITWTAVPWYIGDGARIRAATAADLRAAEVYLERFLDLLPQLQVIVLVGRKAQRLSAKLSELRPGVSLLACPHPSPLSLNGRPERRTQIVQCLREVARLIIGPLPAP